MSADKQNDTIEESPELLMTLRGHSDVIRAMAITPDGKNVVSSSQIEEIKVWELTSGLCKNTYDGLFGSLALAIAITPDSKKVIIAQQKSTLRSNNLEFNKHSEIFEGHNGPVDAVAISPDGKTFVSGSYDKTLKLWDFDSQRCQASFEGHLDYIKAVAFTSDGEKIISGSSDDTLRSWSINSGHCLNTFKGHGGFVWDLAITPDDKTLLSASWDRTVKVWDIDSGICRMTFEGHTEYIGAVDIAPDGITAVTGSADKTIKVWNIESGQCLTTLTGHTDEVNNIAITPDGRKVVSSSRDSTLRIWDLATILASTKTHSKQPEPVRYTTAKLVLVGDSGVGKTGLGWRLAHNEFKEHASTHGQQFWVIGDLCKTREDGTQCEAVLWDLAGQPDYRLVHSLFLGDVDTALVLFDPTNRQEPLSGVDFWLNQLKLKDKTLCKSILVGARTDRGTSTLTKEELLEYCKRNDIGGGYIPTCAANGDGVDDLLEQLKAQIPWQTMTTTVTTVTFKRIKTYVLALKEQSDKQNILVSPAQLFDALQATDADWQFTDAEMMTAIGHLSNHGYVSVLMGSQGNQSILLANDLLVNLVSSMVLKARNNPKGLGVLEEQRVLTGDYDFAELQDLATNEREILLDATAMLFLERNLCFREVVGNQSLLVFPSLINEKRPVNEDLTIIEGASYRLKGAVENLYASMVVQLGYTNTFTRTAQWQNRAQYGVDENSTCGFTQHDSGHGEIELVIYYDDKTTENTQLLFRSLFEHFLGSQQLEIFRYLPVICINTECGEQLARNVVLAQLKKNKTFSFCHDCGEKLTLPDPAPLTQLSQQDEAEVVIQQAIAKQRTAFEAALVRVKRLVGDKSPNCFISYAWGVPKHESWVKQFAKDLRHAGINALLDRWDSKPGSNLDHFIDRINHTDFVMVVGTPALKKKYISKKTDPVVKAELNLINLRIRENSEYGDTVLPLLLEGTAKEAFTPQLQTLVNIDFTLTELYFRKLFDMIWQIFDLPFDHPLLEKLQASMTPDDGRKRR
jgi:small GTP-binding protein